MPFEACCRISAPFGNNVNVTNVPTINMSSPTIPAINLPLTLLPFPLGGADAGVVGEGAAFVSSNDVIGF
ncbi:MAG TPA: hypothetical protein VFG51_01240 [Candidatus Saccharimonadia bacterium]|nr:hypothetical protein [Candidatus Saccharimonadia bacterium]